VGCVVGGSHSKKGADEEEASLNVYDNRSKNASATNGHDDSDPFDMGR
jgi:hypothetical protein